MEFAQPPPSMSQPPPSTPPAHQGPPPPHAFNVPPPSLNPSPRHTMGGGSYHHFQHHSGPGKPGHPYFKPFSNFNRGHGHGFAMTQDDFDGKRLRKSVMRKTVDYNASIVRALENRLWQRDFRDRYALQPENIYIPDLLPPPSYLDNPSNAVTTRFVKTATNKMRCPIFTLAWTPEGRRLVTGASSGEFTLWNGLTFNFETILQAHDVPVRTMVWSHNDSWMVTGDHAGYVKYWQSNMNNVKMFQAHKEPIRGISFSPSDSKFVSCSDDGTLRVWDFFRCQEERVLRGHGADVKCVHWHPQKALIVSGSKDNQQPIKLWDPKSGQALATLHAHKSTVMDLKWNNNGNWLVTASRDHLLKLFDLRNLREEVQVFRGHKKEASAVAWHPVHEGLFSSGGSDGSILFWNVGTDKEVGGIEMAHDSIVWTLAWHPLGHILCSGSNDHTIKFWTRNRPGDLMRDKYNLNTLPASLAMLDECEYDDAIIPGMGPEDKVEFTESLTADKGFIPGLDLEPGKYNDSKDKKVPYSKPIPRNFQAQWNDGRQFDDDDNGPPRDIKEPIRDMGGDNTMSDSIDPSAISGIVVYGKFVAVTPDSKLASIIRQGPEALNRYISAGEIEELNGVIPQEDDSQGRRSPSTKRSRFDQPARNHNAQIIYNSDVDLRQQVMNNQPQPFIPSLLGLKVPQPDEFADSSKRPLDMDFRGFGNEDKSSRPKPWDDNARPSPWATGPLANGFPSMTTNFNNAHPFNGNPFVGGAGNGADRDSDDRFDGSAGNNSGNENVFDNASNSFRPGNGDSIFTEPSRNSSNPFQNEDRGQRVGDANTNRIPRVSRFSDNDRINRSANVNAAGARKRQQDRRNRNRRRN